MKMSNRPRLLPAFAATLLVAAVLVQASSCALATYGTNPEEQTPCDTNANCDDKNPCSLDTCSPQGLCDHADAPDGALATQTASDCKRLECKEGVLLELSDPNDRGDDKNPCTQDDCVDDQPMHVPLTDGASCQMSGKTGTCQMGACVIKCGPGDSCEDDNPCTEDSCDVLAGVCVHDNLDGLPTPGVPPLPGDCQQRICAGGMDESIPDDTDIPDDGNPCTTDICTSGVPSNPDLTAGTPCAVGQPEVCNGMGACVACNVPADCVNLPPDDECQQRTCVANKCDLKFTTAGTPLTVQTPGDCQQVVCDGMGAKTGAIDNLDIPDDNNACTKDNCTDGTPGHTNVDQGTSCGAPLVCNNAGECVGCNVPADCPGMDDFCKTRTCTNNQCGYQYTADGTPLPNGQTAMDCKVVACDGQGNVVIDPDVNDKPVDGLQCTLDVCGAGGTPSNPPAPVNTACTENNGQVCNGAGACKKKDAQTCAAGSECLSQNCVDGVCCNSACSDTCKACNVTGNVGVCSPVPQAFEDTPTCTGVNSCDGAGVCKKDQAQGCANPGECVSGFCVDGVCCQNACTTACRSCNTQGNEGTCFPIANVEDNNPAGVCAVTSSCDASGVCKKKNGQACNVGGDCLGGICVDGICCDSACTGSCQSCKATVKGTGMDGVCGPILSGKDPQNECNPGVCDGAGVCKGEKGDPCPMGNAQCLNGVCADGVCCDSACTNDCYACNLSGKLGTCAPVAAQVDDGMCAGTNTCDGAGVCKGDLGKTCANGMECANGICVDGVCCNTACNTDCKSCNVAGSVGTCTNVLSGTDDGNCSGATKTCDGAGVCKGEKGEPCPMGSSQCLNGLCVDGVCCDTSCGADCYACNLVGQLGSCLPVTQNSDDGTCSGTAKACDGAGVCKTDLGQTCNSNLECAGGHCVDGVCCDTGCNTECMACNVPNKMGTCSNVPAGWDDGMCTEANPKTETCDGMGTCKGDLGENCNVPGDCASGICSMLTCAAPSSCGNSTQDGSESDKDCGGLCAKCVNGGKCRVGTDCVSGTCTGGTCQ